MLGKVLSVYKNVFFCLILKDCIFLFLVILSFVFCLFFLSFLNKLNIFLLYIFIMLMIFVIYIYIYN